MQVGMATIFQNPENQISDGEVYRNELRLANLAEPLGFDSIWGVEHHFTDYTMCPDVMQFLTYMAGRTQADQARLDGGGAAVARSDARRRRNLDARPHLGRAVDSRHGPRRRTRRVRRASACRWTSRANVSSKRRRWCWPDSSRVIASSTASTTSNRAQTSVRSPRKRSKAARTRRRCRRSRSRSWRGSASAFW